MANNPDYIPPIGEPGSEPQPIPPPPSPAGDLGIRTMSGDVNSLGASGGLGAEPRTFRPKDLLIDEPVFSPQIPQTPQMPPPSQGKNHSKALFISIGAVTGLVIVGGLAYFFLFRGTFEPVPTTPPVVVVLPPVEPPVEPVPPAPVEPPPAPPFQHQSLFSQSSGVASSSVSLNNLALADINAGIVSVFSAEAKVPVLKEIIFSFSGNQLTSSQFLNAVIPTLNMAFLEAKLDKDFTAFGYKDKDGVWPGYVFRINPESPATGNKSEIFSLLEQNSAKFYVAGPGAPKATDFKTGAKFSPNIRDIRYLQYSAAGASFNIAWAQVNGVDYAVVSTSFSGIKEAFRLLGF